MEGRALSHAEFIRRALIVIGLVALTALATGVIVVAADVLLVLFGGILFAVFLRGLADLLSRHSPIPQRAALVLIAVLLFLVFGAMVWLLAAEISHQVDQLGAKVPQLWQQIEERLRREVWGRQLLTLLSRAQSEAAPGTNVGSRVAQAFNTTLGAIANFAVIVFIGVYLAANPGWYQRGLLRLAPPVHRARGREILSAIGHTLRWWLFGRVVGMTIVGAVTTFGLWLLDVPLALGLGLIAAALDFVPFVGPIAAAAPGVLVALSNGPTQVAYVVLLYMGIQLIEGYVLTPLIEQRSVRLPPALTIGAQVLLGVLVGALGVVFATPLTAVLVVLIKKLYVEDTLEHRAHPRKE
ncbi:MAG: AI-2E family transporter [Steroidobacter sp.]